MPSFSLSLLLPLLVASPTLSSVFPRQYNTTSQTPPTAQTKNGTYVGRYASRWNTDYFLGMPYAQPPVGDLRFHTPMPLETYWNGSRNATEYGPECFGYGRDTWSQGNYVSEDCLTLNVVRSRGSGDRLPVLVWIHGGGLVMGGSADHRYNQTFMVQQSAEAGMPIVAVSINYRLSSWGFLYGKEIQDSGNTMNGLRDQRLALQWVQDNIAAFGGDPGRVTIQGESSGGTSVGAQLLAYDGRDDGLFSGAIAESGNPVGLNPYPTVEDWAPVIANISRETGCSNATNLLTCLRAVPTEKMNDVINSTATSGAAYGPVIDGDFIVDDAATQLQQGRFVSVPYLLGCNSDEGTGFGPQQINSTQEVLDVLQEEEGFDMATAQDLAILYPDIPEIGVPASYPGRPNGTFGSRYKRTSAMFGDFSMHGPRRWTAMQWVKNGAQAYTYRFNVVVNGVPWTSGAVHFQEVAFVFYNTMGLGYPQNGNPNPLGGPQREKYLEVSKLMSRMWISFVNFGNPNKQLGVEAETWPAYSQQQPQNFVFEQNITSHAEPDYYRAEGIHYIGELIAARHGRNCSGLEACGYNNTD
ncbi:uncharacterized protein LTR77_001034 [Saxophila tyrrhenica]|uniref:Carboxylic ester hydrolase n=1 Tax=Saxophila tyrrhenica TaxID=1690608 RepID=A0AAV9PPB1_9PEZI|nr:hypothetical protein LTR77_001034 [Saxophila tyrrhenica]